jgi:hypothetical protein
MRSGKKCYKVLQVKASWYPLRKRWRVLVPPSDSSAGKRISRYFLTKEEAEQFISTHKRSGFIELTDLLIEEKHVLGLIRQSPGYTPDLLLKAWRQFENDGRAHKFTLTIKELAEKFYVRQEKELRSVRTLSDDRWRLNKFSVALGSITANACRRSDLVAYLESIPPGTNRRSHYKTLKKLWRWASDLGYVEYDPMVRLKPLDAWGINNEILSLKLFRRFLRVAQGLEAPREGLQRVTKYRRLVPYLVLGGLQGLRTCEMVREDGDDPVLEWTDFLWKKKLIVVRDEVAKQTRARDKLRYIPLEPTTTELLKPFLATGPVIQIMRKSFYGLRKELCKEMRVRWPENCLRNSYATYAQTFRNAGDVAKAMGDAESTVKRFYTQTLEPGVGHHWFDPLAVDGSSDRESTG